MVKRVLGLLEQMQMNKTLLRDREFAYVHNIVKHDESSPFCFLFASYTNLANVSVTAE